MENEALGIILVLFVLAVFVSLYRQRPQDKQEHEEEELESVEPELIDELLNDLRELSKVAHEVTIKRLNGEVVRIKYKGEKPEVQAVASSTNKEGRFVLSADGRSYERETLNWGGEQ